VKIVTVNFEFEKVFGGTEL